ncbi:MAG: hypothetical protein JO142_07740 [Burkholderiales bacterium]|nr:hypothetical protein [Burkholderiales bacterium]
MLYLNLCAAAAAQDSRVLVHLQLDKPDVLTVSYRLPPSCRDLAFINDGIRPASADELRRDWQPADDCARVDGQGLHLTKDACSTARFLVPVQFRFIDRVYPWAQPIGGGVYAHTQSYAVKPDCGPVDWRFSTLHGTLVINGKRSESDTRLTADTPDIESMPVLLFDHQEDGGKPLIHIDPALPNVMATAVMRSAGDVEQLYSDKMQASHLPTHSMVVARAPHGMGWWGDAANRTTLRLMVQADASPGNIDLLKGFIAHELAHFLQPRDIANVGRENQALILEGGAEYLRWYAQASLGWKTAADSALDLQRAFNACALATQQHSWADTPNRGWGKIPYDCGLAFHAIALADRQTSEAPISLLDNYYHQGRGGTATDFATALECGSYTPCTPRWLPRLLNGKELVTAIFDDFARHTGLLLQSDVPDPATAESLARSVFANLMKQDCQGEVSTWADPGVVRIGSVKHCKALREGMRIDQVDGLALISDPNALSLIEKHCTDQGNVTVALQGGGSVALACSSNAVPHLHFYSAVQDALIAALDPQ